MPTLVTDEPSLPAVAAGAPASLGWALRRAALGITILFVAVSSVAWLTYASIDPDLERDDSAHVAASPIKSR